MLPGALKFHGKWGRGIWNKGRDEPLFSGESWPIITVRPLRWFCELGTRAWHIVVEGRSKGSWLEAELNLWALTTSKLILRVPGIHFQAVTSVTITAKLNMCSAVSFTQSCCTCPGDCHSTRSCWEATYAFTGEAWYLEMIAMCPKSGPQHFSSKVQWFSHHVSVLSE